MNEVVTILDGNIYVASKEEFDLFIDNLESRLDSFNAEYGKKYDIATKVEAFKGIGLFLKNSIKQEEIEVFVKNIKSIYSSLAGSSEISYEDDFNARFNNKHFGVLTVIYLLMIKCNKEKTFKIPSNKLYLVLNSAMRGNGYECFEELLSKVTNDKMLDLINKNGFIDGNESTLLALSNQVQNRKDEFKLENLEPELDEFIRTKKDMIKSIPVSATKEERLQIELANNAVFHVETFNRAKEVNQNIYGRLIKHEDGLTKYARFNYETGMRFLEIDKAIRNRETRFDATALELIALDLLSKINIDNLENRDICNMSFRLSKISDMKEYEEAISSLMNEYPKLSKDSYIEETRKI